jgi:hypothetical protein
MFGVALEMLQEKQKILYVKCSLFSSYFNQNWAMPTDVIKPPQHQIS